MKRRKTKSQEAILTILKDSKLALNHDMLQAKLKSKMDRATIYRILNRFSEDGLIHKIIGDDGKQYFAICINCGEQNKSHSHNHLHFRCLKCGKVECLNNDIEISLPKEYTSKTFNGFISGYCNHCS